MAAASELAAAAAARKRAAEEAGAFTPICGSPVHARELDELEKVSASAAHIRVAVRVRPVPPGDDSIIEVAGLGAIAIRKQAATGGNEFLKSQRGRTEERMFDRAFGPDTSQAEVYEWSCRPLVTSAVEEGRSATVFVYGATSAGKTHTMFGEREGEQQGMIYRAVQEVFDIIGTRARSGHDRRPLEAKLSFLDIYNETVRDLLQEGNAVCKVLEDERRGVVKVSNVREVPVRSVEEALKQLRIGLQARKVEATAANARSSRSHAVFQLSLERVEAALPGPGHPIFQRRGQEQRRLHSCISLIDLAGSERATQTQNRGSALKDGAKINQSLLALANCIDALVYRPPGREGCQTPRRKPPYRDSKLTLLLKGSLMSDCLVSMIANVHPGRDHFEDSNNTLEYAKRASVVKAPVVVRRQRAISLPASRPPSESPPPSPRSGGRSDGRPGDPAAALPGAATPERPAAERPAPPVGGATALPKRRRTLEGRPPAGRAAPGEAEAPRLRAAASEEQLPERARTASAAVRQGRAPLRAAPEAPPRRHSSCRARASHCSECPSESGSSRCETSAFDTPHGSEPASPPDSDGSPSANTRGLYAAGRSPSPLPIGHENVREVPSSDGLPTSSCSLDSAMGGAQEWTLPAGGSASSEAVDPGTQKATHRPVRHAASPRLARHHSPARQSPPPFRRKMRDSSNIDASGGLHASPGGMTTSQNTALLLRIVETLQADKVMNNMKLSSLRGDRDRLEAENAQLRAANLEKDRQIAVLLSGLHGDCGKAGRSPLLRSSSRPDLSPGTRLRSQSTMR